jgi:hypothetical protein
MENNNTYFTINKIIFLLFLGILIHYFFFYEKTISYGEGVLAPKDPKQKNLFISKYILYKGAELEKVAEYKIIAKVLSKKDYKNMIRSTDLALGWGKISNEKVIKTIKFSQSGRWYRYTLTEDTPVTLGYVARHSANTHIIPADKEIEYKIKKIKKGHLIKLEGFLVNIRKTDGSYVITSKTRKDRGAGACETFYVEKIEIIN